MHRNRLQYTPCEGRLNSEAGSGMETNGTNRLWVPGVNGERYSTHTVKERVQLYLHFPSSPSWPVLG
jgi:hypothetical protein